MAARVLVWWFPASRNTTMRLPLSAVLSCLLLLWPALALRTPLLPAAYAASAEQTAMAVRLPSLQTTPGQAVSLPVTVDRTDNLAGLKLVLRYDPTVLRFVRMDKSAITAPLMHVVNDKTPGRLIVVMAGARGIKGERFPLAILRFTALKPGRSPVTVEQWEFMADTLKPVAATVRNGSVTVSQGATP